MIKRCSLFAAMSIGVSGCASVHLEGSIGESCPAVRESAVGQVDRDQFGFLGQIHSKGVGFSEAELMQTPRTDLLTQPIDATAVTDGLKETRQPSSISVEGVEYSELSVPWDDEYEGVDSLPAKAITEANNARAQIARFWTAIPGKSSDFRTAEFSSNQTTSLGTLTYSDAKFILEVERTLAAGGYDALTFGARHRLLGLLENPSAERKALLLQQAQEFNTARFISTYYRAYFRGGRFIQVSLDTDALTKSISDEIVSALKNDIELSDEQKNHMNGVIKEYLDKTCQSKNDSGKDACVLSRSLGDESFVTRAGLSVQFAGVSVGIGSGGKLAPAFTYPPSTEFGPQMARVAMEAVFDSRNPIVPAVDNSTACKSGLYMGNNCLSDGEAKSSSTGGKEAERIKTLDTYAGQAEATVTAATSVAIRGLSIAALNNEAVAKSVETMAGVSARKIVEKVLWSRYMSGDDCANDAGIVSVWAK